MIYQVQIFSVINFIDNIQFYIMNHSNTKITPQMQLTLSGALYEIGALKKKKKKLSYVIICALTSQHLLGKIALTLERCVICINENNAAHWENDEVSNIIQDGNGRHSRITEFIRAVSFLDRIGPKVTFIQRTVFIFP